MGVGDLTAESVWAAINEFDRLGRTAFLAQYGFGPARGYFVDVNGTLYDSKALAGAAHGHLSHGSRPLAAAEFSGGERTVAAALQRLGFAVRRTEVSTATDTAESRRRNPSWSRDELILALELYLANRGAPPGPSSHEVLALSKLLNQLGARLGRTPDGVYRNANGVAMKLQNFRRLDPAFTATGRLGLTNGGKEEEYVWVEFAQDPDRLRSVANAIRNALDETHPPLAESETDLGDDFEEAPEGRLLTVTHFERERNRKLIEKRKARALKMLGRLACEACDLDFAVRYGARGVGFIEVHHTKPLHTLADGHKTRLEDLALLCSNCHRMIHRRRPWLTVAELKKVIVDSAVNKG